MSGAGVAVTGVVVCAAAVLAGVVVGYCGGCCVVVNMEGGRCGCWMPLWL